MHDTYQIDITDIHWSGPESKFYQAQFKLASSVQVQLRAETGLIVSTQEAEIWYAS